MKLTNMKQTTNKTATEIKQIDTSHIRMPGDSLLEELLNQELYNLSKVVQLIEDK